MLDSFFRKHIVYLFLFFHVREEVLREVFEGFLQLQSVLDPISLAPLGPAVPIQHHRQHLRQAIIRVTVAHSGISDVQGSQFLFQATHDEVILNLLMCLEHVEGVAQLLQDTGHVVDIIKVGGWHLWCKTQRLKWITTSSSYNQYPLLQNQNKSSLKYTHKVFSYILETSFLFLLHVNCFCFVSCFVFLLHNACCHIVSNLIS